MASLGEQTAADPGLGAGRTSQPECLGMGLVSSGHAECPRRDSVDPPESRQENQTVPLLPEEKQSPRTLPGDNKGSLILPGGNQSSLILPGDNKGSLILPGDNKGSLMLPEGNQSSLMLPEGNQSSLMLPEGNQSSLILPGGNQSSLILPGGNQSSLILPEGNQSSLMLPEGNQSSLVLPEGNQSSLMLPEGNQSSLVLPEGNQSSLMLPEDNQSSVMLAEDKQSSLLLPEKQTVLLLGHNQENSVPSEQNREQENVPNPEEEEEEDEEVQEAKVQGSDPDPQWVEERFRIDRKKLEFMLYAPKDGDVLTGEEFFTRVMSETHTQIKWPSKLKIGAKSKKDPHVKVEGKRRDVLEAKKKILQVLETKVNKVTLKVDVPHTEHSHVIGKGGGNIKRVMEVTSCHVHFPDSNRHQEKGRSNQVSIAGPVEGVEAARRKIRELQPLALTFDLPVSLAPQALPDAASPVVQQVAAALGVTVSFRAQSPAQPAGAPHPLYGGCCTVRGLQGCTGAVKKAVCILVDLLLGSEVAGQAGVIVSSQLDVTSQQHVFLLAGNGAHFLGVMHQTGTQIIIPDLTAPLTPPTLLIQGPLEGVCAARQQLMECLPVCLMFDVREDRHTDAMTLSHMMHKLGVFISVKPKAKQTTKSVVVKGLERNIHSVYEARCSLLGLTTESSDVSMMTKMATTTTADNSVAPPSGLAQYWLSMLLKTLSDQGPVAPTASTTELLIGSHSQLKPRPSPPPGLTPPTEAGLKYLTPPTEVGLKYLNPPTEAGLKTTDSRTLEKILENDDQSGQSEDESSGPMLMTSSSSEVCEVRAGLLGRRGSLQGPDGPRRGSLQGPDAPRRGSLQGPDAPWTFSQARRHSTGQPLSYRVLLADMEGGRADRRNGLRREMELVPQTEDYEQKKLLATRAMQRKPVLSEVRTPTDTWSGLGFSKSMPAEELRLIGRRSSMPADELRLTGRRSSYKPYLSSSATQGQVQWACPRSDSENWRDRRGSASSSLPVSPSSPSSSSPEHNSFPVFASSSSRGRHDTSSESGGVSSSRRASTCSQRSPSPQQDCDRLAELLKQLGVAKYTDVFTQQEIDFQTFLTLSDEDLKEVGVATFGARRKMLLAIYDLKADLKQRRSSDTPTMKPVYLEGGASGRLPPILDVEAAAQSCRW